MFTRTSNRRRSLYMLCLSTGFSSFSSLTFYHSISSSHAIKLLMGGSKGFLSYIYRSLEKREREKQVFLVGILCVKRHRYPGAPAGVLTTSGRPSSWLGSTLYGHTARSLSRFYKKRNELSIQLWSQSVRKPTEEIASSPFKDNEVCLELSGNWCSNSILISIYIEWCLLYHITHNSSSKDFKPVWTLMMTNF